MKDINEIYDLYRVPGRHYHTPNHIIKMLGASKLLEDKTDVIITPAQKLAILYHDSYMEADAPVGINEELSTELLFKHEGVSKVTERAAEIIRYTTHLRYTEDKEISIVLDLDLVDLGTFMYKDNAKLIRQESRLPLEAYVKRRLRFLKSLLNKSCIYYNQFFIDRYEEQARINLNTEVYILETLLG